MVPWMTAQMSLAFVPCNFGSCAMSVSCQAWQWPTSELNGRLRRLIDNAARVGLNNRNGLALVRYPQNQLH